MESLPIKMTNIPMSKKKYEQFKEQCEEWFKVLSINHIERDYVYGCSKNADAESEYDKKSMTATISLKKRLKKDICIVRLALHEVLHIAMWEMLEAHGKERDRLEHEFINRVINLIGEPEPYV
jgi:uncharacterized tellurite resistance protein B-like protein